MPKGFLHNVIVAGALISSSSLAAVGQIIPPPSTPILNVSTVSPSGDQNPFGVAFVPDHFAKGGTLNPGDILVSNFADRQNRQGVGSTIMRIQQSGGPASVFYQGPVGQVGLTSLAVLTQGFVLVGSAPSGDGNCGSDQNGTGGLLIIDRNGNQVGNISDNNLLNAPWGLAFSEQGTHVLLFVSNVGTQTITRISLKAQQSGKFTVENLTQIASGFSGDCDPPTFVMGTAGLAYDASKDVLYVASIEDNAIFAVANASTTTDLGPGTLVYRDNLHLHGSAGLVLAPNGDLITSSDDAAPVTPGSSEPSEIVEFTPAGQFVGQFSIDPAPHAALGMAIMQSSTQSSTQDDSVDGAAPPMHKTLFAAVNKNTNSVEVWQEQ
jgi:hypothetical protein